MKLPEWALEKIELIEMGGDFNDGVMGLVWLKDGWVFSEDDSHVMAFEDRADLLDLVRGAVRE